VFSDGIYENFNEDLEIYTEERFIQFLADNAACSTEELLHKVRGTLDAWSGVGNLSDDVSLVVAERF
jgi:serine phosphatase RsbU (regulator of sigma subunit)